MNGENLQNLLPETVRIEPIGDCFASVERNRQGQHPFMVRVRPHLPVTKGMKVVWRGRVLIVQKVCTYHLFHILFCEPEVQA